MAQKPSYFYKISIIGDKAVGKTSLIDRFVNEKFEEDYIATMGVNITLKDLTLKYQTKEDFPVQLMLWDIGGSEKWENLRGMFYRGSSGVILVYDVTRPATFLNITHYLQDLENSVQKKIPFILIGNKNDLSNLKKINPKTAESLMQSSNAVAFFETSAKTGKNVEEVFRLIAQACYDSKKRRTS